MTTPSIEPPCPLESSSCRPSGHVSVEFVEDRDDHVFFDPARNIGPKVASALLERGVVGRAMPQGDILGFAPPLCLSRDEADIVVKAPAEAMEAVLGWLC